MIAAVCPTCRKAFKSENARDAHVRDTHENPSWVKSRRQVKTKDVPVCPVCGSLAKMSVGKFGDRADCCGLWSWGFKALVDRETHVARIMAHKAFDQLWKQGLLGRSECYQRLQRLTGMTDAECHFSLMTAEQADQSREIVERGMLLALEEA